MGKSSSQAAPPPDPQIGAAAVKNAELGKQWLALSEKQYASGLERQTAEDALVKQVVDSQIAQQGIANGYQEKMLGYQDEQMAMAKEAQAKTNVYADKQIALQDYQIAAGKEQDAYNKATFRPVEQRMVDEANNYDSPERQEQMAAEAKADVMDGAARAKATNERSMASMGVNPSSGRFAGITRATDTAVALQAAGAQNQARDKTRDMGIMLRKDAANYSKGMASTAAQSYGIGMQAGAQGQGANSGLAQLGLAAGAQAMGAGQQGVSAGSSAIGSFGAGQQNFYQNNSAANAGIQGAIGANQSSAGILQNQYQGQLQAVGMNNQQANASNAGLTSAVGMVGGLAVMF